MQKLQSDTDRHEHFMSEQMEGQILTVRMVSDYLHCHPSTIYRLIKHRAIPAFKIGADWRFHKAALENWLRGKMTSASM